MGELITKTAIVGTDSEGSDQTGQKLIKEADDELMEWLRSLFPSVRINDEEMFLIRGGVANLVCFPKEKAFCFEFAQNETDARNYLLEDGEWYYLDDSTLEEMKTEMLEELENAF